MLSIRPVADGDPHGSTWTGFKTDGPIAAEASQWLRDRAASSHGKPWLVAEVGRDLGDELVGPGFMRRL